MTSLRVIILLLVLISAYGQDKNCNFHYDVQAGQSYEIHSPNYPNDYSPGVQCRWTASCPHSYNCRLHCEDVNIPQTSRCSQDRLLISETGDLQLSAAEHYCEPGPITALSNDRNITVGLISANDSPGGSFVCQLTAQQASSGDTDTNCQCGWQVTNRIVGGSEAGDNQYPFMVGVVDLSLGLVKCGGVIIDNNYVLTAGHCLVLMHSPAHAAVIVGVNDITNGDSLYSQVYKVSNFVVHPRFDKINFDYDIGILVMRTPITFSDAVGPVCLPFKFQYTNTDFAEKFATILGWGTQFVGGPISKNLLQVDVQVISDNKCSEMVTPVSSRQMCNYTPGKDSCQDDSGGPLLYTDHATGRLFSIGIISNGRLCAQAGQPGINTRVTTMLSWIEANTPLANFCKIGVPHSHGSYVFSM